MSPYLKLERDKTKNRTNFHINDNHFIYLDPCTVSSDRIQLTCSNFKQSAVHNTSVFKAR